MTSPPVALPATTRQMPDLSHLCYDTLEFIEVFGKSPTKQEVKAMSLIWYLLGCWWKKDGVQVWCNEWRQARHKHNIASVIRNKATKFVRKSMRKNSRLQNVFGALRVAPIPKNPLPIFLRAYDGWNGANILPNEGNVTKAFYKEHKHDFDIHPVEVLFRLENERVRITHILVKWTKDCL